jgi:acyl-CoA thioesterase
MAQSLAELVELTVLGSNRFESRHNAEFNGGLDPRIGYGGGTLAFGINAASATVKETYRVYSALGNFLSSATTDQKLHAEVTPIRDTRIFATRRVEISQHTGNNEKDGKDRNFRPIMFMVVDFQVPEPDSLLTYSAPSTMAYSSPSESLSQDDMRRLAKEKNVSEKMYAAFERRFGNMQKYAERRSPPEGISTQTFNGMDCKPRCTVHQSVDSLILKIGMVPELPTTQDSLAVTDKRNCFWFRSKASAMSHSEPFTTIQTISVLLIPSQQKICFLWYTIWTPAVPTHPFHLAASTHATLALAQASTLQFAF